MTTVVVVHKSGTVAIAADSLVTFGDTRLAHRCEANEKRFRCGNSWIGTGRAFALGGMPAAYDQVKSARDLAELGVRAGCEFDKNSSGPVRAHTITLKV